MRSGKKNSVVSIYRMVESGVTGGLNSAVFTPTLWKSELFCIMTSRRGKEVVIEGQVQAETYKRFEFELFDVEGIEETMFVRDEAGLDYDIKTITGDDSGKDWIIVEAVLKRAPTGRT